MGIAIFGWPNRADSTFFSVAFSGGSWQGALPLTNLTDPILQNVARSTDVALTSTKFVVDLGAPRNILLAAIAGGNYSTSCQVQLTGYSDAGLTQQVTQVTWQDVWPTVYPFGSLAFEDPSWWTGKTSPEDAMNYPQPIIIVLPTIQTARYWLWEFSDASNTAGYLQLTRLFMCPGIQATVNIAEQASLGWESATVGQESLDGVMFFEDRPSRRNLQCTINALQIDEALTSFFEMFRDRKTDKQIMFVYDPSNTTHIARRSFPATIGGSSAPSSAGSGTQIGTVIEGSAQFTTISIQLREAI